MQPAAWFSVGGKKILKETSGLENRFYDHHMGKETTF